jgi:hypothetical protein
MNEPQPESDQQPENRLIPVEQIHLDTTDRRRLVIRSSDGRELEIPMQEFIQGPRWPKRTRGRQDPGTSFFRCGNCLTKLPRSGDAETDHHTAMRHTTECERRYEAKAQLGRLVEEFEVQKKLLSPATRKLISVGPAISGSLNFVRRFLR